MSSKLTFLFFSILILIGCSNSDKEKKKDDCPYKKIQWLENSSETKNQTKKSINPSVKGKLETILKKIIEGAIEIDVSTEFQKISEDISKSSNSFEPEFKNNWNALVSDLCGKWFLLKSDRITELSKKEIEADFIKKVNSFYELSFLKNASEKKKQPASEKKKQIPPKELVEISIHLEDKFKEFQSIFVDGADANILPNSTELNPRLLIESHPQKNQLITIVTAIGDTCFLSRIFDKKNKENFPIRFFPNCK